MMIFETERLFVRPLRNSDIRDLQAIAGNDTVAPMLATVRSPWVAKDVQSWIEQGQYTGKIGFRLGLCRKADKALIGVVALGGSPVNLAYFLDQSVWGQGLVTEAVKGLLHFAFTQFEFPCVTADSFNDNPASMRVLDKLGFKKTGQAMGNSAARLDEAPVTLYRLSRTDFESLNR